MLECRLAPWLQDPDSEGKTMRRFLVGTILTLAAFVPALASEDAASIETPGGKTIWQFDTGG